MSDDSPIKGRHRDRGRWTVDLIPPILHDQFRAAVAAHDVQTLLTLVADSHLLSFVLCNTSALTEEGIFEEILVGAYARAKLNGVTLADEHLEALLPVADHARLLAAGDPLPGPGPFTLYRGINWRGDPIRGFSWTSSFEIAKWDATEHETEFCVHTVYRVTARREWVLAYLNKQGQDEYLLQLPRHAKVQRIWRLTDERRDQPHLSVVTSPQA
jgi:hypothetical protein